MLRLRPYQGLALREAHAAITAGYRRILVVSPTGSGKGLLAVRLMLGVAAKARRAAFSAPRRVIVEDAFGRLVKNGMPADQLGMLMADDARARPGAQLQVASLDTLRRRDVGDLDLIGFDEAHMHLDAQIEVAQRFPRAVIVGFSATPIRGDGRGLGELYQRMVVVALPSQLIAEGWLVKPRIWTVPDSELPDVSKVPKLGGDFEPVALSAAVTQRRLVGSIVQHWLRRAEGRRTVAFAGSVEHSRLIVQMFLEAGVPAEHLQAETPTDERNAILGRLERRETLVVSNYGVLGTGWDMPSVKCAILARPTHSEALSIQWPGRIMRPSIEGEEAIALDHAGVYRMHGLPYADREYSLDGKKKLSTVPAPRTCERCYAVYEPQLSTCPRCGLAVAAATSSKPRAGLKTVDGELVELTAAEAKKPQRSRAQYLNDLVRFAAANGLGLEWVLEKHEKKHGKVLTIDLNELRGRMRGLQRLAARKRRGRC